MKYNPPLNATDPDAPFVTGVPGQVKGSALYREVVEYPQREIVNAILAAGLTPSNDDLTQLAQAISILISRVDKYDLGQYYPFQDTLERPGLKPLLGGLITNVSQTYPQIVAYLQTPAGQARCVSQADWDALHIASWATLADGTQVSWDGIGGVNKFVLDLAADTLRLPDLAGMSWEQIGFDSLGLGDVHGWGLPAITGNFVFGTAGKGSFPLLYTSGAFSAAQTNRNTSDPGTGLAPAPDRVELDSSRQLPVAAALRTRAFGVLACVYLGKPAS